MIHTLSFQAEPTLFVVLLVNVVDCKLERRVLEIFEWEHLSRVRTFENR